MNDGTARVFDHVLLGTGYRVDVTRYPFLSPALRAALRRTGGYPQLDAGFESSVPGLHFVGAPAAWSFGPLTRFVAGCAFTARAVARRIDASRASRPARRRVSRRAAAPVLEKVA
jgi:hypothetical protein